MTEKHPLTKEMLDDIAPWPIKRLPYEYDTMRTVADWQLRKVVEWLHSNLNRGYILAGDCYIDTEDVISSLKEDLRPRYPQEDN